MLRVVIDRVKEIEEDSKFKSIISIYSQTFTTISLNDKRNNEGLESNILMYFDESQSQLPKNEDDASYVVLKNPDVSNNLERSESLGLIDYRRGK